MAINHKTQLGYFPKGEKPADFESNMIDYANIKLASRGAPTFDTGEPSQLMEIGKALLDNINAKNQLLADYLCPADQAIQDFLTDYLDGIAKPDEVFIPTNTVVADQHGLNRVFALPPDKDTFNSDIVESFRVKQGVCHNPKSDRRTTKGVFHIAEGGLPVPADKKEVPKIAFANLLRKALNPPKELLQLPFTSTSKEQAELFVSMMIRPLVVPEVPGYTKEKTMEIRYFAPGNLVSNLDFVESIFGNAGDPFLAKNDARLDVDHWSGHTGFVLLAPHIINCTKKELGLPHKKDATPRQIKDGMCWEDENEKYNDGGAFKITARDSRGIVTTVIADNYFGYCKKEAKTQITYAANLYGLAEEEHAGGALAFPSFDLGESFKLSMYYKDVDHSFAEVVKQYGDLMDVQEMGYAVDKQHPDIFYIPEDSHILLRAQTITWTKDGEEKVLKLTPNVTYVLPSGYKVTMERPETATRWRLVGTTAEGTFCHKPCTVSGGGKSEISKSISDAMISGPVVIKEFKKDLDTVEEIINKDFSDRYMEPKVPGKTPRPLLSPDRSFGSVVKLLTPNPEYREEYNEWINAIPRTVRDLVLTVKRFYKPAWGDNWRERFHVDSINGFPGHELKYRNNKLVSSYIRVGFTEEGNWRIFALRKDFMASFKLQLEDDISVSATIDAKDAKNLHLHPELDKKAYKFIKNCEYRLFQRPDDAIHRGYDKKTEWDFSQENNFFSNYGPITREQTQELVDDAIGFGHFTDPLREELLEFANAEDGPDFVVSTSHPRIFDGQFTKNPRYLQNRPDLEDARKYYLGDLGARLFRRQPLGHDVMFPVSSVLVGRRNNPPDHEAGIRPLAVYNPIHYQELPELFMDFTASLTGKSPSTTGAGTEGALTKSPFNCLPQIIDLNNALVSYLLTEEPVFSSAAGNIGHKFRFDHDISMVIPEIWSRMHIEERDPQYLIDDGMLEPIEDFEYEGRTVAASRLGYRITEKFTGTFFGRMFSDPTTVFTEEMLKPELQGMENYIDGIDNIVEAHTRVAKNYLEDGTVDWACPPMKALLHIMANGEYEGKGIHDPEIRNLFTRDAMINSDWYAARIDCKVEQDIKKATKAVESLKAAETNLDLSEKLAAAEAQLEKVTASDYRECVNGTLGTDPALYA